MLRIARRVCVPAIACTALACTGETRTSSIPPGSWTGDLHAPGLVAAIGFLARVPPTGDTLDIVAFGAMGFNGGLVADLRVRRDTIAFTWTSEDARACVLERAADGAFVGDCTTPDDSTWSVRLAPPTLRNLPVGYARSLANRSDYAWTLTNHPWGRLYLSGKAGATAVSVSDVASRMQSSMDSVLGILGEAGYDRPVDAFLVDGRPDLASLMGQPVGSTADPLGSTVILAKFGTPGTIMRHEIMHVLSINLWGSPPEPAAWIREGIATFAGGHCARYGLHQLAASLMAAGDLLPLRTLIDQFYRHDDLVTYLESASLFQHIYQTRGRDHAHQVWTRGLEAVLAAEGKNLGALEAEWRAMLADPELHPEAVDWSSIRGIGCG